MVISNEAAFCLGMLTATAIVFVAARVYKISSDWQKMKCDISNLDGSYCVQDSRIRKMIRDISDLEFNLGARIRTLEDKCAKK